MTNSDVRHKNIGRKIERLREIKGIKQEVMANELGITQQAVSKMEQSDDLDDEKLDRIAKILGLTADDIRNYNEEATVFNIQNMNDNSGIYHYHFNPIDKLVEVMDENRKLYERLLKEKDEVIEMYQKQLKVSS